MPKRIKREGRAMPVKHPFMKLGILKFKPTLADRAKIAAGYAIEVSIQMNMQHNCGQVEVASTWRVTEYDDVKGMDTLKPMEAPKLTTAPIPPEAPQKP